MPYRPLCIEVDIRPPQPTGTWRAPIASQQPAGQQAWFGIGAATSSFVWFIALGFGAQLLGGSP